ncbi:MAG TPA: biotin/lipoyl-containing protein [Thermoanaerobaculia bacterium]|jgi:biotin carboxyl carrier protein|nr:biotin/lipoyl-containing protein [Thermoanaerobaculia bacterium]
MEVVVRLGDREERVQVRRLAAGSELEGTHEIRIGERTYVVDATHTADLPGRDGAWSLRLAGQQHEVSVRARGEGMYEVGAEGRSAAVEVLDPLASLARASSGGKAGRRRQRVTAYMPGRVVAVLAVAGEEVKAGQGIVVLEAMKMQNEILAEHDGVLKAILVQPGQAVEGGDPLFEME